MGQGANHFHWRGFQTEIRDSQWCHGHRGKHSWMDHCKIPSRQWKFGTHFVLENFREDEPEPAHVAPNRNTHCKVSEENQSS
jgi:hypothetical protein